MKPADRGGDVSVEIRFDTMIYKGKPISLASPIGALTVLHGALQSAIGSVDDALRAEKAYLEAAEKLAPTA